MVFIKASFKIKWKETITVERKQKKKKGKCKGINENETNRETIFC